MRTIMVELFDDGLSLSNDTLGRAGEKNVVQFSINFDALRDTGLTTATLLYQPRNSPVLAMPSVDIPAAGRLISQVPDWAMSMFGVTQVQLQLTGEGVETRSCIWHMRVERSLINYGDKPAPVQDWLEEITDAIEKAEALTGLKIIDFYATFDELSANVTNPNPGDAYATGTVPPYDVYVYGETSGWVNVGPMNAGSGSGAGGGGAVNVDATLTVAGAAADAAETGSRLSKLSEEIVESDLPLIFYGGAIPQIKDVEVTMPFDFCSKSGNMKIYCETKAQGNSSMAYPKKNQTTKFFADAACTEKLKVNFRNWGKQNKFCMKANWIDLTHARNIVSARIWGDVVRSRANFGELPELLRTSPNVGAIDGFPVLAYVNGEYHGRYTINIPKDGWMANMDDDNPNHCILCGENYVSGCFRATAKLDESDWSDELHKVVPENIKTRWNEVISFVMNSSDEEFKENLGNYFYVDSLIDYLLYALASCGLDSMGKNQIYMTYDGQKWIASMYDMDSTWGLYYNGSKFVSTNYARTSYEDYVGDRQGNLLYIRLEQNFSNEIQARWLELKAGALSYANVMNHFERFFRVVPPHIVEEDYAITTGDGAFIAIPSQDTNNIQQIRAFALARQAWTDEYVAALGESTGNGDNESILYQLAEPTVFNGTSDYIDTGIKLAETDIDFTIAFHVTPTDTETVEQTIYHCMYEVSPYPGYVFGRNKNAHTYWQTSYSANYNCINANITGTSPFKVVITHEAGSGKVAVKALNNGSISDGSRNDVSFTWVTVPSTLIIGAYQTATNVKGRFWKGTMHDFKVIGRVWSAEEIATYLQ